jgi:hypothetical protein
MTSPPVLLAAITQAIQKNSADFATLPYHQFNTHHFLVDVQSFADEPLSEYTTSAIRILLDKILYTRGPQCRDPR